MVSIHLTLLTLATFASAQNPLVAALASNIVQGIVAAKTDSSVSDASASAEIQAIVDIVTKNSNVDALLQTAIPQAIAGLDSNNFPQLLSQAGATLDSFEGSPDFQSVLTAFSAALSHYDPAQARQNVINNLGNALAILTPDLPTLTPQFSSEWASATQRVFGLAAALGLVDAQDVTSTPEASTSAATTSEASTVTSSAAETTSTEPASSDASSASSAESTEASTETTASETSSNVSSAASSDASATAASTDATTDVTTTDVSTTEPTTESTTESSTGTTTVSTAAETSSQAPTNSTSVDPITAPITTDTSATSAVTSIHNATISNSTHSLTPTGSETATPTLINGGGHVTAGVGALALVLGALVL